MLIVGHCASAGLGAVLLTTEVSSGVALPYGERVVIAVDIRGIRFADYAWDVKATQVIRSYSCKGTIQTSYFGSKEGANFCVYDKGAEQNLGAGAKWTRMEFRGRPNRPVIELPALQNPFEKLSPIDVRKALIPLCTPLLYREWALRCAQLDGIKALLATFPDTKGPEQKLSPRARAKVELNKGVPTWWTPEVVWGGWGSALQAGLHSVFVTG